MLLALLTNVLFLPLAFSTGTAPIDASPAITVPIVDAPPAITVTEPITVPTSSVQFTPEYCEDIPDDFPNVPGYDYGIDGVVMCNPNPALLTNKVRETSTIEQVEFFEDGSWRAVVRTPNPSWNGSPSPLLIQVAGCAKYYQWAICD